MDNSAVNQDLLTLERQISGSSSSSYLKSINKQYTLYTLEHGQIAYPPSYQSIGSFVAKFAADHDGSSKSIANIVSAIKMMCQLLHLPWLNSSDAYKLQKVTKQIKRNDGIAIKRKAPLTLKIIIRGIAVYWNTKSSGPDMLAATISLIGHDCLFRGQDTFSGIKVKDVHWDLDKKLVNFHVGRPSQPGKVAKDGSGYDARIGDYSGPSGYKYLKSWFDAYCLWNQPTSYIFPRVLQSQMIFTEPTSKKWYERQLSLMLSGIGQDPSFYSVHSHRAGGATDLFAAGVPLADVMSHGRWSTDTALIYYRDKDRLVFKIAHAFGTGKCMVSGG